MSRCAALLSACTPASVRLEIVNLMGSIEFSRVAASCRDRVQAGGHSRGQSPWNRVWAGIGVAGCSPPPPTQPVIALTER